MYSSYKEKHLQLVTSGIKGMIGLEIAVFLASGLWLDHSDTWLFLLPLLFFSSALPFGIATIYMQTTDALLAQDGKDDRSVLVEACFWWLSLMGLGAFFLRFSAWVVVTYCIGVGVTGIIFRRWHLRRKENE